MGLFFEGFAELSPFLDKLELCPFTTSLKGMGFGPVNRDQLECEESMQTVVLTLVFTIFFGLNSF